jgi:RimJ/RimL family protein N-acetyltransferase
VPNDDNDAWLKPAFAEIFRVLQRHRIRNSMRNVSADHCPDKSVLYRKRGYWDMAVKNTSFDLQPTLQGKLLQLRPLRPDDYRDLYAVASDPLIWEQHPAKDRCEEEAFKEFFRKALDSGGALVAIDNKDGRVIGSSRFYEYDEAKSEIEIGWTFLARSHWGGVYNREMKELMLQHAFGFVDRVIFLVDPQNLRSQRAVEKIGGVRLGSRQNAEGRDSFVYQLTAAAFAEGTR